MRYAVIVSNAAYRDLTKLHSSLVDRVQSVVLSLEDAPRPHGIKKLQGYKDYYRIRVGDYRIIYHIDDNDYEIIILSVAHRRDAYRK